jgi:hypothetical protein
MYSKWDHHCRPYICLTWGCGVKPRLKVTCLNMLKLREAQLPRGWSCLLLSNQGASCAVASSYYPGTA